MGTSAKREEERKRQKEDVGRVHFSKSAAKRFVSVLGEDAPSLAVLYSL